jgi:hexaprenyl-diphosphate synthase
MRAAPASVLNAAAALRRSAGAGPARYHLLLAQRTLSCGANSTCPSRCACVTCAVSSSILHRHDPQRRRRKLDSMQHHRRSASGFAPVAYAPAAVDAASAGESWVPSLDMSIEGHSSTVDPFRLVASDLEVMTESVRQTVSVLQHPVLDRAASHLFSLHGKRLRPIIVILMGHATAQLNSVTSPVPSSSLPSDQLSKSRLSSVPHALLDSQLRLAEITEMIHAASLLHDDVIDIADSRRGLPTVNSMFGNQLAILAGDFLLARASVALARLRDCDVVELLSTVIEHLVRGEVIQMNGGSSNSSSNHRAAGCGGVGDVSHEDAERQRHYHNPEGLFETYMAKTFFKTASLMANSCRAVTMLAGHGRSAADAAYLYGENLGIAFQLVDDMLDFTSSKSILGKPVLNDLGQGHATAPVLFALDVFPDELGPMIARRFRRDGDVQAAVRMVNEAEGIEQTRVLAAEHARRAVVALVEAMPPSEARSALVNIADHVLARRQ